MEREYSDYDKEKIYNESVYPLVKQIFNICCDNGIPFVTAFAVKNDHRRSRTVHKKEGNLPGSNGLVLYNDYITDCLLVLNGTKTVAVFADSNPFDEDAIDYIMEIDDAIEDEGKKKGQPDKGKDKDKDETVGATEAAAEAETEEKERNAVINIPKRSDKKKKEKKRPTEAVIINDDSSVKEGNPDSGFAVNIIGIL